MPAPTTRTRWTLGWTAFGLTLLHDDEPVVSAVSGDVHTDLLALLGVQTKVMQGGTPA